MKTFIPAAHFTGYPDGNGRNPIKFRKGQESPPVPDEFADLMFEKGLAEPPRRMNMLPPPKQAVARKIARATRSRRTGKASRSRSASKG